ncbi:FIST N-terminal domain-containing protein [Methylobacterium sp. J-068]|uniref:FIST N-terminal domain-containing protein n=1 Tax=Methylobacterium sp. J-068 TaxID=2836649 RepID=UPI001FBB8605|nr:FIST N-terminal domain-containing protein [Methylobacterium sp. J-068]MCJ2037016.1 FIST C-terminal domain-containing protein [Methylobacterium sp. J-068]
MAEGTRVRTHLCGITTAWTEALDAEAAITEIGAAIGARRVAQVIAFFSADYDVETLNRGLIARFPGAGIAGCTMSGGISPAGGLERGLVVIAFPVEGFRIVSTLLDAIDHLDVERTASSVRALRRSLGSTGDEAGADPASGGRFALSLIDGLANAEETVVSAIAWALDGIPLVGGSAGDDLTFRETVLLHDGRIHQRAAVLLLVETAFPIQIFKSDNFEPTDTKFVVTASDDEQRTVHELNAEPAAREYAMAVGLDPERLSPMSFAAYPLAVKVGGEYFCRSIRRMNADGSLSFFCAIDEGVVLTLARPRDIVAATAAELARLDADLGGIDLVIGFECVLRRLDAESRQVRHGIFDLYRRYDIVGFDTYGEQYRSMHLNQTFTGIAIGRGMAGQDGAGRRRGAR